MNIGSCVALNLSYSGCCAWSLSPTCFNNGCYCDKDCHHLGNCCSDVAVIDCHPVNLGKRKQKFIEHIYIYI